uniref:Carboxylic ester hydrolase n=1 Tax=Mamestra brassicae TaxID=55057 RepID=Q5YJK2_MAMBR|nr:antennal esterase [Mamestra brassicae]
MKKYLKSLSSLKLLVLISLWVGPLVSQPTAPVQLSGQARGEVASDGSHLQYFGIPYATVTNRFQEATPNPKWEGVYDANNEHIRCKQRFHPTPDMGDEDCLTVNVYTPVEPSDSLRPVMVFIHGGAFRDGSGSPFLYGPKYLVKHGVILVTFNYRLEILGFLCLGIKEAPGNIGLKDQVQALKWVKRNIRVFGGDPDNITIFGESAGSASVSYHLLSPMSKGLFNRAILQSGSALSFWALQFEPLKIASLHAQQMGYTTTDPKEIYNLFNNVTADELLSYYVPRKEGDIVESDIIFVPCVEKKIRRVTPFLPDSPYNLITQGKYNKVPIIIGFNSAEGYYFAGKENDTTLSKIDFYKAMPRDLTFPFDEEKVKTANRLNELYLAGDKITKEKSSLEKLARFKGDADIIYPVLATIDLFLQTTRKPVYAYKFNYDGLLNLAKMTHGFRKSPGATHGDELFYLFSTLTLPALSEVSFIDKFTTLWTNFAKYSDPTPASSSISPKWEPAAVEDPRLLLIDRECSMEPVWGDNEAWRFWNETYALYRRKN